LLPKILELAEGRCVEGAHRNTRDAQTAKSGAKFAGCPVGLS
jgi:hypothetical protein